MSFDVSHIYAMLLLCIGEVIMSMPQRNSGYGYDDYVKWNDGRWELFDGEVYDMSPWPSQAHQETSVELLVLIHSFLKGKPCKVFSAPFDVRLNYDGNDDTVCQPDLLVVCDASKLDGACCKGAPDFIVEIISPSTARMDRIIKFEHYRRAGVREYWIIDPEEKTLLACVLNKTGKFEVSAHTIEDVVAVSALPGLSIALKDILR
jgi:Uma2 family endonuclease